MQQPDIALEKKIGSGSFGDVFLGHLRSTGEKIAVKRVKKKTLNQYGDYLIKAFWKEIESMKLCACENSVRLIQTMETENNYNIVMELCDTDLLIHLNKSPAPFTTEEVRDTFSQLNNVFKIMQKHNIIHRDLKLGNILIKYTDEAKKKFIPKLSDYGFSKDLNNSNYTATHLGTPATMAPEIMMNLPYNEKSDLWSVGAMMYQLHFKAIPYPGFSEGQILKRIQTNYPRKQPTDPDFRDLLNKIFVLDPKKRISWEEYFNHPFWKETSQNNNKSQFEKICDIDLGYNYNNKEKDLFFCFIAKDNKNEKKVLIKSYREDLMEKNNQLFEEELNLFKSFKENKRVLNLLEAKKENNRFNMIFEYIEAESITNYISKNKDKIDEKFIKKFNQILYNEVFMFNESTISPFIFISIHNFLIDKDSCPIVFDFGIHKLLIKQEEYSLYFLPNNSEMNYVNLNKIKTNVMNYGITLLKIFSENKVNIKGKEIILDENIILSEDFRIFLSKCLTRNTSKRASWDELKNCIFLLDNNNEKESKTENLTLIDDDKLNQIFEYLNDKFETIINYYSKEDFKNTSHLSQIEIFVTATLFEMRIIDSFFNRNIDIKPFTNQQEISFISIDTNVEMNKCDLNFVNPVLKDIEIIKMNNNKIIKDFLVSLQKNIKKVEKIVHNIHKFTEKFSCSGDYNNFLQQIINSINSVNSSSIQQYFSNLLSKSSKEKNDEIKYYELCIAKYLIEFILNMITIINDRGNKIYFNRDNLLRKFYKVFGEEKNKIEISSLNLKDSKSHYLIVSFLPILFKCREADLDNKIRLSKDRQSINGWIKYYPSLMKKINELKSTKK